MSRPASRTALIELDGVGLRYRQRGLFVESRDVEVLCDISFDIRPGETVGILGRNGAGKSSLLRMMAGVFEPDSGVIRRSVQRIILLSYQLGFVPHLTGRENAIHSALLQGLSREQAEGVLDEVISFSGLEDMIDQPLRSYSAGMKARLGFSVAIQSDPDVILIDEALGVGDHEFRAKSVAFMKNWIKSNKTVVFVSHDEDMILDLCDRAVWIEHGALAMQGPVEQVLEKYHQFDAYAKRLAVAMNVSEQAVRADPSTRDPLAALAIFQEAVRELDESAPTGFSGGDGVCWYRPRTHEGSQQLLIEQDCSSTVWIDGHREVGAGADDILRPLFEHYQLTLAQLAQVSGKDPEALARGSVGRALSGLVQRSLHAAVRGG